VIRRSAPPPGALYHLGFTQCTQDGRSQPETGNAPISGPMRLTADPIGSIADRVATHVSAGARRRDRRAVAAAEAPLPAAGSCH
jgi:hypothetical protein